MPFVGPRDASFAQDHDEPFAVVGELEDLLPAVVDDPDVTLGIQWIDLDPVRPATSREQMIVLRPRLDDAAFGIDHDDASDATMASERSGNTGRL